MFLADGTTVQADDTYRNLSVNEQGTAVTTTATNAGGTVSSFVIFYRTGLTMPLLAVGGSGFAVGQTFFDAANNRWGFIITSGAVGSSVPYYIFDVPFATDPHFLAFRSSTQPVRRHSISRRSICASMTTYQSSVSSIVNKTYDASRVYACIHMITGFRISAVAGSNTQPCCRQECLRGSLRRRDLSSMGRKEFHRSTKRRRRF